jgi:hypothetical protein
MNQITDLHAQAMALAERAESAQRAGAFDDARSLFRDAFMVERDAAMLVSQDTEPTRSVLFRSAASLAVEAGEYREAERLIGVALAGNAHEEIRDELRDLYETINFHRHLDLRGTKLYPGELQLAIAGDAVGFGIIPAHEYIPRVQTVESLIVRTAERQRGVPFRERGRPMKSISDDLPLFMSVNRAASFAVTIRVGRPLVQKQLFNDGSQVVNEFLECVKLFVEERRDQLSEHFDDTAYYRNFVQQAKRLAPDGQRVRTVGFTSAYGEQVKTVAMRQLPSAEWTAKASSATSSSIRIVGELTEAAKKEKSNTIGLKEDNGRVRTIQVPRGLMSDIVRPLWERRVEVTARERGGALLLQGIDPVEDQS